MGLTFLTPLAAAFGCLAAIPVAVHVTRQRRARRIRRALGLREPSRAAGILQIIALALVPALIAVAAAQPVVTNARVVPERADAQVIVVLDVSRSMLASRAPGSPTRFERARDEAIALEAALADVPMGIASLTDRLLPHLFPTTNRDLFVATATEALGIERPPPSGFYLTRATKLEAIGAAARLGYFPPRIKKRALVVFTDGETDEVGERLARDFARRPRIETVFVHVWGGDERIYESGVPEEAYEPDDKSAASLREAAGLISGSVFDEGETAAVAAKVREIIGSGPVTDRRDEGSRLALIPYVTLLTVLPLGFLLYRRNL